MDKISTKDQKFQPKISNFSENISCICCAAAGCHHKRHREIVKSKHYQSTQFFKETFSDHNNNKIKIDF